MITARESKFKTIEELAASKLWEVLTESIEDIKFAKEADYILDMTKWLTFDKTDETCAGCFAGMCLLKYELQHERFFLEQDMPDNSDTERIAFTLNTIRRENIEAAVEMFYKKESEDALNNRLHRVREQFPDHATAFFHYAWGSVEIRKYFDHFIDRMTYYRDGLKELNY